MPYRLALTLACLGGIAAPAAAQQGQDPAAPHGQIAIGAGAAPDFEGSDELRAIPFVLADIRWRAVTLELRGLRARVDLAADPRLSVGPLVGARLDRRNVDGPVGLLPEIDMAIEAGGYVGYRFGGDRMGQGALRLELSVAQDVSGTHDGLIATANADYSVMRSADSFLSVDVQASWADGDYTRTYFGISPPDSVASGLAAYDPGSGFRDIGAGISAGHYFNRHLGLIGRVGTSYLVDDAADSPITGEGSRWQPMGGLTLSYRF